jgi:hypothetical protein
MTVKLRANAVATVKATTHLRDIAMAVDGSQLKRVRLLQGIYKQQLSVTQAGYFGNYMVKNLESSKIKAHPSAMVRQSCFALIYAIPGVCNQSFAQDAFFQMLLYFIYVPGSLAKLVRYHFYTSDRSFKKKQQI